MFPASHEAALLAVQFLLFSLTLLCPFLSPCSFPPGLGGFTATCHCYHSPPACVSKVMAPFQLPSLFLPAGPALDCLLCKQMCCSGFPSSSSSHALWVSPSASWQIPCKGKLSGPLSPNRAPHTPESLVSTYSCPL